MLPGQEVREHLFKTAIVGAPQVGKTALRNSLMGRPVGKHKPTVGVDFELKVYPETDGDMARIQMWDISGEELITGSMMRVYLKESQIVWLCFNPYDKKTFNNTAWQEAVKKIDTPTQNQPKPDIYLVATHSDINDKPQQVTQAEMEELGERLKASGNFCGIYHVSTKAEKEARESVEKLFNDSCTNRIQRVTSPIPTTAPVPQSAQATIIPREKLIAYLEGQIARLQLESQGPGKKIRFEELLERAKSGRESMAFLIADTRTVASEHRKLATFFERLYSILFPSTSLREFNDMLSEKPSASAPPPSAGPNASPR